MTKMWHLESSVRRALIVAGAIAVACGAAVPAAAQPVTRVPAPVRAAAQENGRVRIIVELTLPARFAPEGALRNAAAVAEQRRAIGARVDGALAGLPPGSHRTVRRYQTVPYVVLEVSQPALDALESMAGVSRVLEDVLARPVLADSAPLVQGDLAWASGYDGTGWTIAVLDSGVDAGHPFLAGKVVEEACYSTTQAGVSVSVCPNGQDEQLGPGAGVPCTLGECLHGTHVAGIAAGDDPTGERGAGVARGATVMAVQVFTNVTDAATCGGTAPCLGAYTSDVIAGLERVYQVALEGRYRIASVNMSLGSGVYGSTCDSEPYKPAIDNLRAMDIPSVVAAGNDGWPIGLSSPACISTAVSVGATTKTDSVAWFSNSASFLSLFAPGEAITSAIPGGGYEGLSGTSMAAPHVAGAWAIARQAVPTASVNAVLTAIRTTGVPITDTRLAILGLGETVPRLQLFDALIHLGAAASPPPLATALAPLRSRVGAGPVTLTVSGAQFNWQSVVQWNGVPRTTAFVNSRTLVATIPASDLTAAGTAEVRVSTPAPGGGVSGPLTFNIDPPPSLTVGATTVTGGSQATVTLANGYGGSADWLALAAVGAANTTYLQWTYVGAGVSNRSWTVTMPTTPGQYEFRLLLSNSYTRAATSPVVNVVAATPPAITVSATTVAAGASLTATLTNAPGGSTDWLAFASTAAANGGYLTWIYVGTGTTSRTWTVQAPTTPGTYEFRLFLNGGYILDTRSPAVTVVAPPPPNITVDSSTVAAGSDATATLTNSPGGATDWLALAPTTAGDTSYLQYVYVGAGITNRTWTVAAPATPGTYEFRLFLNNGFTRAATSPPFTVQPGPPVVSTLSPASASAGGAPFTLTVDGSGFTAGSVVRWNGSDRATTYVSATRLRAAILAGDLAAPTTAQITVFAPDGGGLSSPRAFQITPPPALTVDVIAAAGGSQVTVTLTGGLGGATDWLAFASTSAPNTSYVQYVYVGAGVTNRTWTVTTPVAGGIYEFRLFPNNGYTRAATSPGIAVSPGPNPVPTLTSLSPNRTTVGSGTTTVTVNGTGFVSSSIVRFNGLDRPTSWVSPTQMRVVLWPGDLAVGGTAEVTVFTPAPGGGLSAGRPFEIVPPPSLTVSAASVVQGGSVTVTLTDGLGGATDWLALAVAGAPNTSYLTYIYVGPGITTRTWTIPAPGAPGTYEFRLFLNNTYARAATSPTVTVF